MNSCTEEQKVQRSHIQMSFTVNGALETYGDHSEDGVDHAGTDRGIHGLGHPRSLKDPSGVVKHLQRRTSKVHLFTGVKQIELKTNDDHSTQMFQFHRTLTVER